MTGELRPIHGPDDVAEAVGLNAVIARTGARVRQLGATRLEHSCVDSTGTDWDERFFDPETGLARLLHYRAVAVFPDGHTVIGDSDEFKSIELIYLGNTDLKIQACERLLAAWTARPVDGGERT